MLRSYTLQNPAFQLPGMPRPVLVTWMPSADDAVDAAEAAALPRLRVVLFMDRSGSMNVPVDGTPLYMLAANAAAELQERLVLRQVQEVRGYAYDYRIAEYAREGNVLRVADLQQPMRGRPTTSFVPPLRTLCELVQGLTQPEEQLHVVFMTDGCQHPEEEPMAEVYKQLDACADAIVAAKARCNARVAIHAMGMGNDADATFLSRLVRIGSMDGFFRVASQARAVTDATARLEKVIARRAQVVAFQGPAGGWEEVSPVALPEAVAGGLVSSNDALLYLVHSNDARLRIMRRRTSDSGAVSEEVLETTPLVLDSLEERQEATAESQRTAGDAGETKEEGTVATRPPRPPQAAVTAVAFLTLQLAGMMREVARWGDLGPAFKSELRQQLRALIAAVGEAETLGSVRLRRFAKTLQPRDRALEALAQRLEQELVEAKRNIGTMHRIMLRDAAVSSAEMVGMMNHVYSRDLKGGLATRFMKLTTGNANMFQQQAAAVAAALPQARWAEFDIAGLADVRCFMSQADPLELLQDGDAMCIALEAGHPASAIAEAANIKVHAVGQSFLSARSFQEAAGHRFRAPSVAEDELEAFQRLAREYEQARKPGQRGRPESKPEASDWQQVQPPSAGHNADDTAEAEACIVFSRRREDAVAVTVGTGREVITAAFPLYINAAHWAMARAYLPAMCGWIATGNALGYSPSQPLKLALKLLVAALQQHACAPSEYSAFVVRQLEATARAIMAEFAPAEAAVTQGTAIQRWCDPRKWTKDVVPCVASQLAALALHPSQDPRDDSAEADVARAADLADVVAVALEEQIRRMLPDPSVLAEHQGPSRAFPAAPKAGLVLYRECMALLPRGPVREGARQLLRARLVQLLWKRYPAMAANALIRRTLLRHCGFRTMPDVPLPAGNAAHGGDQEEEEAGETKAKAGGTEEKVDMGESQAAAHRVALVPFVPSNAPRWVLQLAHDVAPAMTPWMLALLAANPLAPPEPADTPQVEIAVGTALWRRTKDAAWAALQPVVAYLTNPAGFLAATLSDASATTLSPLPPVFPQEAVLLVQSVLHARNSDRRDALAAGRYENPRRADAQREAAFVGDMLTRHLLQPQLEAMSAILGDMRTTSIAFAIHTAQYPSDVVCVAGLFGVNMSSFMPMMRKAFCSAAAPWENTDAYPIHERLRDACRVILPHGWIPGRRFNNAFAKANHEALAAHQEAVLADSLFCNSMQSGRTYFADVVREKRESEVNIPVL